ncbi:MAG: universal stress protein [Methylocystis sp.]
MYSKILVPVDLAETEMTALALAAAEETIRQSSSAFIRLLNIQPLMPIALLDYIPPNFDSELRENAEKELADIAEKLEVSSERISTRVRFGAVYPEVLAEAEAWKANLIIVGSHRPTMATYLLGSNANTIVRHARCSVLVARK